MDALDYRITKHVGLWLVVLMVIFGMIGMRGLFSYSGPRPNNDLYQVVLLENDQVYYGKLHDVGGTQPYLTDVYYLNPQGPALDKSGKPTSGNRFTVVKRGYDELHMPTDALYIPRENIMYWENVGTDSLVAKGIVADKDYRMTQKAKEGQKQ